MSFLDKAIIVMQQNGRIYFRTGNLSVVVKFTTPVEGLTQILSKPVGML